MTQQLSFFSCASKTHFVFQDQTETLLRHEADQTSLNDQYLRFLSELQKTVLDFSKRYRKLVSNFNPKSKGNDDLTYNSCLLETLKPLQDTGAAFEQYANELLKSVIEPMKKTVEKDKKQIEKVNADYLKLLNKREHERRKLDDTWRAHVLALKEKQKYQQLNAQVQQDMSLSREELKKSEMAYNSKVKAFKDSQQTYAADMTKYNSFQRHFYAHHIYNVITELESLDYQRAACNKSLLLTCATLGQSMAKQVEEASSSFGASVEKMSPEKDCMDILEKNRSDYLCPVDLPFLNLEQCSPATLESHSALMNQMLGTTSCNAQKTSTATSGILSMFGKSRSQSVDGNPLRTAFIGGIGLNPVKLDDMTVIQVSERIRAVKENLEKVKNDLTATKRLQTAYQQNASLGNLEEANAGVAKLERQLFSVSDLLSKLEKHFESVGGARALAQAQSSLEATNPYTDSTAASSDSLSQQDSRQTNRRDSSFNDSDSDLSGYAPAPPPTTTDSETLSKPAYVGVATAKYDYEGDGTDYLTARVGQLFYVVELDNDNSGWTPVVSEDGNQHGFVPTAYMDIQPYQ
ncbi:hypothetical protein AAHC03_09702 [Spirometra sp. Aus1]